MCSSFIAICVFFICTLITVSASYNYVTCGSVVKLLNENFDMRLHSHDVKYGTGSGQQSVTATEEKDDINSHWLVKGKAFNDCTRGEPIKCGNILRLEHLSTNRNLHSHHFPSPLSNNQEVSAFGEKGEGDTGDLWRLMCTNDYWDRGEQIRLKHVDTDAWLSVSGNAYGRPISGQMEVVAINYPDASCFWKSGEGVFIKPSENVKSINHEHTEL